MRTKFICIIWTQQLVDKETPSSWGLSLFVLFEPDEWYNTTNKGSWGLSLFVLFEPIMELKRLSHVLED